MSQVIILLLFLLSFAKPEVETNLYPPPWTKFKHQIYDDKNFEEIEINENYTKGCFCRKYPKNWTICFGNDSCQKFPRIIVNTTNFKIHTTMIQILHKNDFKDLSQLYSLNVEGNTLLSVIEPGIFSDMSDLTNVSISFNPNLKTLHEGVFEGLVNLKELFLVKNGFQSMVSVSASLSPKYLPNILKISLSENLFRKIGKDDFEPMRNSTLRELNLVLCQIDYMHSECLTPLTNLAAIRLGENFLNASIITELITDSTKHEVPLQFINLYGLGFRKCPPKVLLKAISQSTITQLCLARNQFEVITNDTFPPMPSLKYLDLREVLARDITSGALLSLPNLRTLLLSGNNLSSVPNGVLLEELTYLDLSSNSLNPSLPGYFSLQTNKFIKLKKLKYLNLSYNRILNIYRSTFNGLAKLRVLGLKNASIHTIADYAFSPLSNLLVLNLENNRFELSRHTFTGLNNLQVLLLGGCGISNILPDENPFYNISSLSHLCLENNNLKTLSPDLLVSLPNLATFDISKNYITSWEEPLFTNQNKLSVVLASYNKFSHLTISMLSDFKNLTRLDISKNPFICDCFHFEDLSKWFKENQNSSLINVINAHPTFCTYPYKFNHETILTAFDALEEGTMSCAMGNYKLYVLFVLPSVILVIVIIISCILGYFFRWHIRYWLFLARAYMLPITVSLSKNNFNSYTNYQYDAFVSYSNEDKNFVVRLVAMLENFEPFLKLCVYERDFEVGSVLSDTVLSSIEQSRMTILIISDSYARSEWCRWEVQIVQHHRLSFECLNKNVDDSLVMIKLGNVKLSNCTPTLKYLMKTRIYLEWDSDETKQSVFWDKLRKILSPPKTIYDSCV
ncbi:hypothetical protein RN001_013335 [Aquatica leii]|uniref:TIR domain-containing protein n=1 Tax=Aquatica leii TaxID=1421715 RepID=A0AAN7SNP5_9COLE|nr:hypothetical protein RN001_013335 [Aquatica leii]